MDKKIIRAALLGFGTVGTGVYKVLQKQKEDMIPKFGSQIEIKKILVRNLEKAAAKVEDPAVLTNNWDEIVNDPEIDIVIELIGGIEPARSYILAAINAGKHVVTANKDLIAVHGKELLDAAEAHHVDFLFEAAVAGGIPIIRPLKECLAGNHMAEVMGIVNGTTNFILTKMTQDGMEFKDALALATELGYAEADPTADIEGLDAGRKVAILASVAFNSRVVFDDVYIDTNSNEIAEYADKMGFHVLERKPELAQNTANGNDLLVYHYNLCPEYDYYFQLFATAPYLQPETIQECVNRLTASEVYDSVFTATKNHGFYWLNGTPINYRPGILPRSQDMLPVVEESTGLYGIKKESLEKYRCRIGRKPYIYSVSKFEAVDINTEEDLKIAEYVGKMIFNL